MNPPSPNLEHLSPEEIRVLGDVFNRLEHFEEVETARISQLRYELGRLEDHMRREMVLRGSVRHMDLRLCRLCFRNKFADGVGRSCAECQRRVCLQCGSFTKSPVTERKKKIVKGRWRCLLCQKRRELACASGIWFHGGNAKPSLNTATFKRKVSDVGLTSDWGCSADVEQSDSSHQPRQLGQKNDLDVGLPNRSDDLNLNRRSLIRRRLTSATSTDDAADLADDEDIDVDDEKFLLERQRCRQERLQMQHRKSRRRHRKSSVGTCTREDGVLPDPLPMCPKHGAKYPSHNSTENTRLVHIKPMQKGNVMSPTEPEMNKELCSSQESLKEKAARHPRVRELKIVPNRKFSAPARTGEPVLMMFEPDSRSDPKIPHNPTNSNNRQRSGSVPVVKHLKRSASEIDTAAYYRSQGKRIIEHAAEVHIDSYSADHITYTPQIVRAQADSPSQRSPRTKSQHFTYNPEPNTVGAPVFSRDNLHSLPQIHTTTDRASHNNVHIPLPHISRPRQSDFDMFTNMAMPTYKHSKKPAHKQYSSLDNVNRDHHLKVPSQYSIDIDPVPDLLPRRTKRGSDDSQEDPYGRRASDTPSGETDATSSNSKRNQLRRSSSSYRFRVIIQRDPKEVSRRTMGLGMRVVGGKQGLEGKLGAFVTWIVRGGPADMAGIAEGDQVLEWNGRSLVDATFEETQQILASSGDTVQLIIMHSRGDLKKRPSDCYKPPPHWRNKADPAKQGSQKGSQDNISKDEQDMKNNHHLSVARIKDNPSLNGSTSENKDARAISGRIQLKLFHDPRINTLSVTLLQAQDLAPRPGPEKEMPSAYAKLQLKSQRGLSPVYKTIPAKNSKNPEWMKTTEITDCDQSMINHTTLFITVWDSFPNKPDIFFGEVLLDLKNANTQNNAVWYSLNEHDENTGGLPPPTPALTRRSLSNPEEVPSNWKSPFKSLPATPAHDRVKQLLIKKENSAGTGEEPSDQSRNLQSSPEESTPKTKVRKIGILKRRVSEVAMKVGAMLVDRRSAAAQDMSPQTHKKDLSDKTSCSSEPLVSSGRRHSVALLGNSSKKERRLSGQLVSNLLLGRSLTRTSSQSSNTCNTTTDNDDDDDDEDSIDTSLRPAPEGDDITSMLGPGQVPPKPSQEKLVKGDIKLGFMITKGQLEVDVICGKGLGMKSSKQAPDTYVKTYLVGSGKRLQQRKTKTIRSCTDPLFRQKLKYSACNVHGRYMQILIKEKSSGFDRNQCLGEVVVKLDQLDLSSHTMGWYKLFKEAAVELGSCESLAW